MDTLEQLKEEVLATVDNWNDADGDYGRLNELLENSLDLVFMISSKGEFRGYELTVTLGGPNVYIRQEVGAWGARVIGFSWGESFSETLTPEVSGFLWDTIFEIWESGKGEIL